MPRLCCLLLSLLVASSASGVSMAWTPIGNPGNGCDPQSQGCFGAVPYSYSIGIYEVTNDQYAEFLNAKASVSDPLGLYHPSMGDPSAFQFGGIARTGSGPYTYSAIAGRGDMPVNNVSFYDALRFANWMNNGQGNADTETGAYTLLGGTPTPSNGDSITRNPGASIALPNEDEWYKAAYYDAASISYFDYPAGFNTQTGCTTTSAAPNSANCNSAVGDLTTAGSYSGSASPYGTFDQGGNVFEWNESIISCVSGDCVRGVRGGAHSGGPEYLAAASRVFSQPEDGYDFIGFRVAMGVPEPSTGLLVIAGLLGLAGRRRMHG